MTNLINIPSNFYKSSDLFGPKEISREITRLSGQAVPTLDQSVSSVIRDSKELIGIANDYLANIHDPVTLGLTNTLANQVCLGTTSSLNSILGAPVTSGNNASLAILHGTNEALNAVLTEGKTNENYNPGDKVLNEFTFALENIFKSCNNQTTATTAAQNISNNVNSSLNNIFTKEETKTTTKATEILNSVNASLNEILPSQNEEVYANSGNSAQLFNYVSSNYENIFSANNGETKTTFAGSKTSYNLFVSVNAALSQLFANPV